MSFLRVFSGLQSSVWITKQASYSFSFSFSSSDGDDHGFVPLVDLQQPRTALSFLLEESLKQTELSDFSSSETSLELEVGYGRPVIHEV